MDARLDSIRYEYKRLGAQGAEIVGEAATVLDAFRTIAAVELGPAKRRREYQRERIAAIIAMARDHSRFWARRIPHGRMDLSRLPLLTRAQLRQQVTEEGALPVGPEHQGIHTNTTSGATAEPLRFFVTQLSSLYNLARYAFDDVVGGRDLSLPMTLMHRDFAAPTRQDRWPTLTGQIWRTGPGLGLPVAAVSVEEQAAMLEGVDAGHVVLRPLILSGLLDHIEATGRRPGRVGEILTLGGLVEPPLRQRTRALLGARIADRYSCEELGPIAFQCPALDTHHHVATSNVVVETVDDRGRGIEDGRLGHVVLSGLNAAATPVLRYDVGDMARLLPRCPCGHGGPALADIRGRRKSLLRSRDGQRHFVILSTAAFLAAAPIRSYRLLQITPDELVLQVEAGRTLTEDEHDALVAAVKATIAPVFTVRSEQVPAIDWGPSGKRVEVLNLMDDRIG